MRIDISGHHVDITDGIRQAVHQKLEKIASHYPQLDLCSVIITVERNTQIAEVTTQYLGATIAVEASNQDLYAAIADLGKKFEAKLSHKKGSMNSNRHQKPVLDEPQMSDAEIRAAE